MEVKVKLTHAVAEQFMEYLKNGEETSTMDGFRDSFISLQAELDQKMRYISDGNIKQHDKNTKMFDRFFEIFVLEALFGEYPQKETARLCKVIQP
jgi:hypothetical protein